MIWVWSLLILFGAYIIGSFPTGYLLVKIVTGEDIRQIGSGNTGATNVKRVLGKKAFFAVMLIDAIKGFIPVILAKYFEIKFGVFTSWHILPVLSALAVIIGHSKSLFLGFTGGKSVATTGGTIIALNLPVAIICFIAWSFIAYFSKYISLASIIAMILLIILMTTSHILIGTPLSYVTYCSIAGIYVIYLHRENIKRLLNGTENKVR